MSLNNARETRTNSRGRWFRTSTVRLQSSAQTGNSSARRKRATKWRISTKSAQMRIRPWRNRWRKTMKTNKGSKTRRLTTCILISKEKRKSSCKLSTHSIIVMNKEIPFKRKSTNCWRSSKKTKKSVKMPSTTFSQTKTKTSQIWRSNWKYAKIKWRTKPTIIPFK